MGKEEMTLIRRKIICYGDSNTYGYDPADYEENRYPKEQRWTFILQELLGDNWEVIPEGLNGRKLPDLKYDAGRIGNMIEKLEDRDIFAVMLGTNDILLTMDPDAARPAAKMDSFLSFLTGKVKADNVLVIAPPHIGSDELLNPVYRRYYRESCRMNRYFGELAASYKTRFADAACWGISLSADYVHFSAEGHCSFAGRMAALLQGTE